MKIEAYDETGQNMEDLHESGDLVCTKIFPCMPVTFLGADGQEKYRKAYFTEFPGLNTTFIFYIISCISLTDTHAK